MKHFLRKILKGLSYTASALLLPISVSLPRNETGKRTLEISFPLKKIGILGLVYGVIQPLSLFLFPRAEVFAKKEGLDPNIIQKVTSAKDIRIIPDNVAGKAYYLFNTHPIFQPEKFAKRLYVLFNDKTVAFHDLTPPGYLAEIVSPDVKKIYLKDRRKEYPEFTKAHKKWVEVFSDGLFTYKNEVSPQSKFLYNFVHELRHTDPANLALAPLQCEGDADYFAAKQLSLFLKQPHFAQQMLASELYRGSSVDTISAKQEIHDTGLYVYLRHTNQPIPDDKELIKANIDAAPAIQALNDILFTDETEEAEKRYTEAIKNLSPLAATKLELYRQAFLSLIVEMAPAEKKKPAAPAAFKAS